MKSDIENPVVEDIALAVVREENELAQEEWNVYMLNLKKRNIKNVLVSSKGYGQKDGAKVKTSVLRHFFETLEAKSFTRVEPIMQDVFGLNNEYWVSFYINNLIYDKKYIFLAESIQESHFTDIPLLGKRGVMIK